MSALLYLDTSAAIKRAFREDESLVLRDAFTEAIERGDRFVTSALTVVELARGARRRIEDESLASLKGAELAALGDLAIAPLAPPIVESARIIGPPVLRSLDAIHLATAAAIGAQELWTYDDRLADAAEGMGIPSRMPGRDRS
ncbi:MAG: type II toxin-antitoxin system VapC family toxin [Actinobacteria bacterium]|nr:type II toxin-antitoxin system VapC family toxin [Actinomycetota bacterium]